MKKKEKQKDTKNIDYLKENIKICRKSKSKVNR